MSSAIAPLLPLDEAMPIPTRTRSRGGRWAEAARMFIYEGVQRASEIARVIGMSADRVRAVRSADKWREFAAQASSREQAERYGLAVPFLIAGSSVGAEIERERDSRAERAAMLRRELAKIEAQMIAQTDKASARYARLSRAFGCIRAELESALGLDVARTVGTAAAISRAKLAAARKPNPGRPAWLDRVKQRETDLSELPPL